MTRTRSWKPTTSSTWGPGAGIHGGTVVAQGTPAEVQQNPASLTGKYLTGLEQIAVPKTRRRGAPKGQAAQADRRVRQQPQVR